MLLLDEVDIEDMGIGWAAREGIMMRTRNHLKTDAETKGESDEDYQPGEISDDKIDEENVDENKSP